ncbi:uncharacterized protein LOC134857223 [Symsagittifera roscoffensis]|uniref:uncharacterized protein LOC134857223 n=1 Tax=Symsagittifera roscoffensis TaxID=84072 RepID=UPI00307C051A
MLAPIHDLPTHLLQNVFSLIDTRDVFAFAETRKEVSRTLPRLACRWKIPLTIEADPENFDEVPFGWEQVKGFLDQIETNDLWKLSELTLKYVLPADVNLNFSLTPFEKLKAAWTWNVSEIHRLSIVIDARNVSESLKNIGTNQDLNLTAVLQSFPNLAGLCVVLSNGNGRFLNNFKCTIQLDESTEELKTGIKYFKSEGFVLESNFADAMSRVCPGLQSVKTSGGSFSTYYGSDRKLEMFSRMNDVTLLELSSWYEEYFLRDQVPKNEHLRRLSLRIDSVTSLNNILKSCPKLESLSVTGSNELKHPKVTLPSDPSLKWDFQQLNHLQLVEFPLASFDFLYEMKNMQTLSIKWMTNEQVETQLIYLSKFFKPRSDNMTCAVENLVIEGRLDEDLMSRSLKRKIEKSLIELFQGLDSTMIDPKIVVFDMRSNNNFYDLDQIPEPDRITPDYFRVNDKIIHECSNLTVWNTLLKLENEGCAIRL